MKERLAEQERRRELSTDPSPGRNSTANVSVELVFHATLDESLSLANRQAKPAEIMNDC